MVSQIIYGSLWVITIFVVGFAAKWWKNNKDEESVQMAFAELMDWADIVVKAAEDLGHVAEMTGEEKLRYAVRSLGEVRDKIGLDITDEQVEMLVRAAYQTFASESYLIEETEFIEDEPESFLDGVDDGE